MTNILNTRAKSQAKAFSLELETQGYTSITCPSFVIEESCADLLSSLDSYDTIIFTSQNAALLSIPYITKEWQKYNIFTTGPTTAAILPSFLAAKYPKENFTSAGLLAIKELNEITGKSIAIICGENYKKDLSAALTTRGAKLSAIPIYKRILCRESIQTIKKLQKVDIITSFSLESLKFLHEIITLSNTNYLKSKPLIVVTEKMATFALELGFNGKVYLSDSATTKDVIKTIRKVTSG